MFKGCAFLFVYVLLCFVACMMYYIWLGGGTRIKKGGGFIFMFIFGTGVEPQSL